MLKKILTHQLSEPLPGAEQAKVIIESGDGNLTIDSLTGSEAFLVDGALEYVEGQEPPTRSVNTNNGQATLTLKARRGKQPWTMLPWSGSNRIKAASGAGNVILRLPDSMAARIKANSGMGKVMVDLCTSQIDKTIYQSPDDDRATDRVEISAESGLGNLIISRNTNGNRLVGVPRSVFRMKRSFQ